MSERFSSIIGNHMVLEVEFYDDSKRIRPEKVVEILNKFQDLSIEDLKRIEILEKENDRLNEHIKRQLVSNEQYEKLINNVVKKNQKLKEYQFKLCLIEDAFRERGILTEKEFLELIE